MVERRGREAQEPPVSDEAVRAATGTGWDDWFALLDGAGAASRSHPEIVRIVTEKGAKPWWGQMITVAYERARGLREANQTTGGYRVSASKTVGAPVADLYEAWTSSERLLEWLPDTEFTVRKATPPRTLRITWPGDTNVEVYFTEKGDSKAQVAVEHSKLEDRDDVQRWREYWRESLGRLKEVLER